MKLRCLLIILSLAQFAAQAQFIEVPLKREGNSINQRIKDQGPISLPFWDDFSTAPVIPDSSLWLSGASGVLVSPGVGLNAPSIKVAVFDGWDASGNPYNANPIFVGKTDSLVSRPIRLLEVSPEQRNSIFLSFYYQKKGNGELPDQPSDSLVLKFKDSNGIWNTVWPLEGESIETDTEVFTRKSIQVENTYIHNDFQFMFQSYGRLNGPFDTWNIDYVFLDKNRGIFNVDAPDRAFTQPPSSVLGQYTGMPIDHFLVNPRQWLDSAKSGIRNLEDLVQPVEYNVFLEDDQTGQQIEQLIVDSAFIALTRPFEFRVLPSNIPDSSTLVSYLNGKDSVSLRTRYEMDSGDKFLVDEILNGGQDTVFYENFDLRVNDTTSSVIHLNDYYSYDDGNAEFGAGINQISGMISYEFVAEKPGFVSSVDIYFANIERNQAGLPIEVIIGTDVQVGEPDLTVIESVTTSIQNRGINEFVTYTLPRAAEVVDTFYVVLRQGSPEFIAVGLDKNTDTSLKIAYNVRGIWEQVNAFTGSLMIRPRFGEETITSLPEELKSPIKLFPNPVTDHLKVDCDIDKIEVYTSSGKQINIPWNERTIDFSNQEPGLYLIRLFAGGKWYSEKIIKL